MAHSTFTLTGKHTTPSGKAHEGRVKVRPNTVLRDTAGKVVLSGDEVVALDESGAWSLVLPCDGPGLNPSSGIGYTVTYQLAASGVNPVSFAALPELAGTTLDVAQIAGSGTPASPATVPIPGPAGKDAISPVAIDTDGVPYLTI